MPLETRRDDVVAIYEEFLQSSEHLNVVPIDRAVLASAARAGLGIKLPDPIHVATAMAVGCNVVLSNDHKLRVPGGIELRALG